MRVSVIGGGVIGVSAAYELAKAGHAVSLYERGPDLAGEASFANGGQISAGQAEPWSSPEAPWLALRSLLGRASPVMLRLQPDPEMWLWLLRFLPNCTPARHRRNSVPMLALAVYSRARLQQVADEASVDYDAGAPSWQSLASFTHHYRARAGLCRTRY